MNPVIEPADGSARAVHPSSPAPGARLFVWGVWTLMFLAALIFMRRYGSNAPFGDEWGMVPALTGHQDVTFEYLWIQHNEHRIPLPKLALLGLGRLTHCDFRAGMVFNVLAMGMLALAMIHAARRLRGWTSYSDAFFPIAFLHWGHFETILSGFQLVFVLSTVLASTLLLVIARNRSPSSCRVVLLAGTCLVALPYCGAQGLALVPALAFWFGMSAIDPGGPTRSNTWRLRLLKLGFSAAALASIGIYYRGLWIPPRPPGPGWRAVLGTAVEFLTSGFGQAFMPMWPSSGFVMPGLLLVSGGLLVIVWFRHPEERTRALGFLSFLGAMGSLALALGWGRSGLGVGAGFASRYDVLSIPTLCGLYLVWVVYGGSSVRHLIQVCLFALMCACIIPNAQAGNVYGYTWRQKIQAFEKDLRRGMPITRLIDRHYGQSPLLPSGGVEKQYFHAWMKMLKRAEVGRFRRLRLDPPVRVGHRSPARPPVHESLLAGVPHEPARTLLPTTSPDPEGAR